MQHRSKLAAVSVLALMSGLAHVVAASAQQAVVSLDQLPDGAGQLLALPIPGSASRPGARSALAPAGPAPALSHLEITHVGSSQVGWEAMAASQTTTARQHGEAQLRVVTVELGYGHLRVARFNGGVLPASANYLNQSICWNGNAYVLPCAAGQPVVGFRRYWKLDGKQNGSFSYQNSSTNPPSNTLSDSISIL